jgi:hypothetical protein
VSQNQDGVPIVISFIESGCSVTRSMISHIKAWHHSVSYAGKFECSGSVHGIDVQPVVESELEWSAISAHLPECHRSCRIRLRFRGLTNQTIVLVPPMFSTPANIFGCGTKCLELSQQAVHLRSDSRAECSAFKELQLLFAPRSGQ